MDWINAKFSFGDLRKKLFALWRTSGGRISLDANANIACYVMAPLRPCLLSGTSVLATSEAAEEVQEVGLFWCVYIVKRYVI